MRHRNKVKTLGREKAQRDLLLRQLAQSLITYEKIETTIAKAKVIRPIVEKLVTKGKKNTLHSRRVLLKFFGQQELPVKKLLEVISPRYMDRNGGYLRIVKKGHRKGDGAEMVMIEFV